MAKENGLDVPMSQRFSDYFGQTLYVSSVASDVLTLLPAAGTTLATTGGLVAGDALYNSTTGYAGIVTAVGATTVTVDDASGIAAASTVRVLKAYEVVREWVPQHGGSPPMDKQVNSGVLLISEARGVHTVKVSSELAGEQDAKTITVHGFGALPFGSAPFGDSQPLRRERFQVPRNAQRAGFHSVVLRTKQAGAFLRLHGLSLDFNGQDIKGVR